MISAEQFVQCLKKKNVRIFTGVPCSFFQSAINQVIDDPQLHYTIVPNEGAAMAVAAGAHLAGRRAAVMIQNSGLGNLVNPLTSLNMIYRLPVLLFISGRSYGVPDEPQHEIIGKNMGGMLDAMGVPHKDLPAEAGPYDAALQEADEWMDRHKMPYVFFVRKGTIGDHEPRGNPSIQYPLKRIEAIKIVMEVLSGDEYVIATTGMPSRELFAVADRRKNFYMQGSMGHAAAIGLGVALHQPSKKIVVLDGDGAMLMHMGILSSIGHYRPKNLYHVVLDNESYETTGDQDTTSATTDFKAVAGACGYRAAEDASTENEIRTKLKNILGKEGPAFLRVKINRLPTDGIPRISTKYTSRQIAENFRSDLTGTTP